MATWMFTALWAWLFSRHNTVDAADYCGMSGDERGRQCWSMSCHIVSAQLCTEGSVSSLPVTLCYQYMFLWPAVDGVTEHRRQTTNDIITLWILQFQKQPVSQSIFFYYKGVSFITNGRNVCVLLYILRAQLWLRSVWFFTEQHGFRGNSTIWMQWDRSDSFRWWRWGVWYKSWGSLSNRGGGGSFGNSITSN